MILNYDNEWEEPCNEQQESDKRQGDILHGSNPLMLNFRG